MTTTKGKAKQPPQVCLECGNPLLGRSDKKYCDAQCRNSYNNRTKREDEKHIQQVNSIIRRNRRILKQLCPQGKAVVRKEVLDMLGYNYDHFSGTFRTSTGLYYLCYDYGFSPIRERSVPKARIIQTQDYMTGQSMW